ncbi:MAG: two-component regulator propeller domain-containing protein, partial [Massilia sp.]
MAALRFLRRFCRRLAPPALLALLVLLDGAPAFASPARTLRFDHLSVEHGLAQESVLDIVQDADGFMWFGSQTGLSRFDGYRVTVYRNEIGRSTSLANNWVRVLHVDRRGRLWVGTDGGLDLFEPDSGHFIHFVPNEPDMRGSGNRHIRAIVDDGAHGLWLATGDGLQHFDMERKVFTPFHHVPADSSSLADDQLNALALDASGRLWVGTASGLDSLARGASSFEHHPLARTGPGERSVEALLVDRAQRLWIGSPGGLAVTRLDRRPLAPRQFGAAEGMRPGGVDVLYQDPQGTLWAGSRNYGLYQWQEGAGRFLNYRHQLTDNHSLSDNQIASIFRDRVGTFWVGTWYAGVNRVDLGSGGFARIVDAADSPEAVDDNKVRVMLDDGAGKLWVGTNGGLRHLDPVSGEGRMYRHQPADPHSLPGPAASALARDSSGQLWVGSRDGIASVDPSSGRFNRQSLSPGEPDGDNVRAMLGDRAGALWVATRGGLHRFDPRTRKIVTYRHDPEDSASLADNMVRPLLEDRRGRFWVGTFNGLDLLDRTTGKFTHYRHDPNNPRSLSHDEVHYLMEDRHGALWVGTALGVNKMVEAADGSIGFERYTARDGLADDAVAAILEDADGHLWISSSTGLSRFSPATNRWRTFSAGDGTIEGAYFDASALRGADGSLYFGGFNGITAFDPKAITDNLYAPRAVITGIQVANRPLAASEQGRLEMPVAGPAELTLDAADSVFSLEFSALHFAAPARNRFAY